MRILACLLILPLCGCLSTPTKPLEITSASAQLTQEDDQYVLTVTPTSTTMPSYSLRTPIELRFKEAKGGTVSSELNDSVGLTRLNSYAELINNQMHVQYSLQIVDRDNTVWGFQDQILVVGEKKTIPIISMSNVLEEYFATIQLEQENNQYMWQAHCYQTTSQYMPNPDGSRHCVSVESHLIDLPEIEVKEETPFTTSIVSSDDTMIVIAKGFAKQIEGEMQINCSLELLNVDANTRLRFQDRMLAVGEKKTIQLKRL